MTPRGLVIAAYLAIALGGGSVLRAQSARPRAVALTLGAGATYGNLTGGDFSGSKPAAGFDANAGVVLGRWQLGAGYDRTVHGHEATDGDYVVSNVYVEPRLIFRSHGVAPYAAVRLGRAMASYEGVLGITDKATGYIAGLGAGAVVPITGLVQVDVAGHYDRLSHDYGTGGYADAERGGRLDARVGLRLTLAR